MSKITEHVCERYNLTILETFALGNVCDGVFKVRDAQGRIMVLKSGTDARSISEIRMNVVGYENMRAVGLSDYIPLEYALKVTEEEAYILMEYCGDDFLTMVRKIEDPVTAYYDLAQELRRMYSKSVATLEETRGEYLMRVVVAKIVQTYNMYIMSVFGKDARVLLVLEQLAQIMLLDCGKVFCFSNWDLTPEDVFMSHKGLKYADPHAEVIGVPMVDIGCFAGVARDAYDLPGSSDGYKTLKQFAVDIAPILGTSSQYSERYFYLGRVLQSFLSARFRLKNDQEKARKIFLQGVGYLNKIVM